MELPNRPIKLNQFGKFKKTTIGVINTMWRIQESILEFKLRYGIEILFNTTIPKAIYNSFIAMAECFICLIKPHKTNDVF